MQIAIEPNKIVAPISRRLPLELPVFGTTMTTSVGIAVGSLVGLGPGSTVGVGAGSSVGGIVG